MPIYEFFCLLGQRPPSPWISAHPRSLCRFAVFLDIKTKVEGRRRSYILTDKGKDMLDRECARLTAQLADYHLIFGMDEDEK